MLLVAVDINDDNKEDFEKSALKIQSQFRVQQAKKEVSLIAVIC